MAAAYQEVSGWGLAVEGVAEEGVQQVHFDNVRGVGVGDDLAVPFRRVLDPLVDGFGPTGFLGDRGHAEFDLGSVDCEVVEVVVLDGDFAPAS